MKNLTMNQPINNFRRILSGLKDTARGVFSMPDENKYTTTDTEVPLTGLLKTSTQKLALIIQKCRDTGKVIDYRDMEDSQINKNNNSNNVETIQPDYSQISREENRTQIINKNNNERSNC